MYANANRNKGGEEGILLGMLLGEGLGMSEMQQMFELHFFSLFFIQFTFF